MYNKQSYNITIVIYRVVGARKKYEHIICYTHPWSYYNFLLQKRWTICNVTTHRCKELIKYMVQVFFLKIIVFLIIFILILHMTQMIHSMQCVYIKQLRKRWRRPTDMHVVCPIPCPHIMYSHVGCRTMNKPRFLVKKQCWAESVDDFWYVWILSSEELSSI